MVIKTQQEHLNVDDVVRAFNRCFSIEGVRLQGGAEEPFFRPAGGGHDTATIHFRADYVRSALHEVAHWCHAGPQRRLLPDYGYWYSPDDRSVEEQAAFFAVEARPQALERFFCEALGIRFAPSVDNLSLDISEQDLSAFRSRLDRAYKHYEQCGLPERASRFIEVLAAITAPPTNHVEE